MNVTVDTTKVKDTYHGLLFLKAAEQMSVIAKSGLLLQKLQEEVTENGLEGETSIWKDASATQIYAALQTDRDRIELMVQTYHTWKNVIGYGLPSDTLIRVNTKYLANYKHFMPLHVMKIGSNLFHEHGHDCGFSHDFMPTKRRPKSICYTLNRAYEKACIEYYELKPSVFVPKKPWWRFW